MNAAAELAEKAKCFKDFGKCLINKGPAEIALDAIQDVGQAEDVNGLKVSLTWRHLKVDTIEIV